MTSPRARGALLFVAGVLVLADEPVLAWAALAAVLAMLLAIGFVEGRWRAVLWALVLVASAFTADVLWQIGWAPFDRSGEYEAIPQTPFVVIGVPLPMVVIALGVGARVLWRRLGPRHA